MRMGFGTFIRVVRTDALSAIAAVFPLTFVPMIMCLSLAAELIKH